VPDAPDDAPSFAARPPWWLARPASALGYLTYARLYAFGTAVRLTLPDALASERLLATLASIAGIVLLAVNGCIAGWSLCAAGALAAIVFHQDQLTQSFYLLACAVAALGYAAGSRGERAERLTRGLPLAVRSVTVGVYLLAGIHKLNRDFLDPAVSCASGGLRVLARDAAPAVAEVATVLAAWRPLPAIYLALELVLLPLLLLRRPAAGVVCAAALHLPLTVIYAPAFAFVMMSGWSAFLTEAELRALGRTLRARAAALVLGTALLAGPILAATFRSRWGTDPDWRVKEALMCFLLVWLFETATRRRKTPLFGGLGAWAEPRAGGTALRPPPPRRGLAAVLVALLFAHGATPYLGLQFHRTGAMLSNLRIDRGCHNSLLLPEWLRGEDPYVRIERIAFAPGRAAPGVAESIVARLWGPEALARAREGWCRVHREPLALVADHRGERHVVDDFCAPEGWPFGAVWLRGLRRWQVNLGRACPEPCIH
jgi:hypothetical protein